MSVTPASLATQQLPYRPYAMEHAKISFPYTLKYYLLENGDGVVQEFQLSHISANLDESSDSVTMQDSPCALLASWPRASYFIFHIALAAML